MNLANKLTVFRVFCIPVFVAAMMITAIPYNYYIALAIFIIAITISQIVSYHLLQKEYYPRLEELGVILFVIFFLINIIFTYYPPKFAIFYDYTNQIYGLK